MSVKDMELYTVWVGAVEVNSYYLSKEKAELLADDYINDGYDDVYIETKYEVDQRTK